MENTTTVRIDIQRLQVLNDRLCQTLEALNQVRLSAHAPVVGGHFAGLGMNPLAMNGLAGYGIPAYGVPAYGTPAYGIPAYGTSAFGTPAFGVPAYGFGGHGAIPAWGYGASPVSFGTPVSYGAPVSGTPVWGTTWSGNGIDRTRQAQAFNSAVCW
jgi:hypothetical protein